MKKPYLLLVFFLVISLILSCGEKKESVDKTKNVSEKEQTQVDNKPVSEAQTEKGSRFSGLKMKDLEGKIVDFDDVTDAKLIIFDLWDTWCPPCKAEIPSFIELYNQYKDQGLLIIGFAMANKGEDVVKQFVKDQNINYPIYTPADREQIQKYFEDASGIPTTYILDGETMKMIEFHVGFRTKDVFEKVITEQL